MSHTPSNTRAPIKGTVIFEVTGQWPFPKEMLEYDSCEGIDDREREAIAKWCQEEPNPDLDISAVMTFTLRSTTPHCAPTPARWKSRCWEVTELHR